MDIKPYIRGFYHVEKSILNSRNNAKGHYLSKDQNLFALLFNKISLKS